MPYKSAKQRAWMHIHEPKIAKKWDKKYGRKVKGKKKKNSAKRGETQAVEAQQRSQYKN